MLMLFGRADSLNVRKVLFALAELGLRASRTDVGGPFGGTDTPEYRAMNPNRLVPTLRDGDLVVWESNAIVRYLAEKAGDTAFRGADAAGRARVDQWMDWQLTTGNGALQLLFWQLVRVPADERDAAAVARLTGETNRTMAVLDAQLATRPFICGSDFTAADVALGVCVHRFFALPVVRDDLPALRRYHAMLKERPGFAEHVAIGKP